VIWIIITKKNNAFLGMFQLLKIFETCSLLRPYTWMQHFSNYFV